MIINFIHIPKNGGSSISNLLKKKLKNKSCIRYNGHNTDVSKINKDEKVLLIVRNPIDRFCSAVRYALQVYSESKNIKNLINKNIITPNKFIEILSNKNHIYYEDLMKEVGNTTQKIGKRLLKWKWTYEPQSNWIKNPDFVILFDNLNEEIIYLFNKLGYNIDLPKINSTKKNNNDILLKENINILKKIYKDDFIIYEKYKNMDIKERINI